MSAEESTVPKMTECEQTAAEIERRQARDDDAWLRGFATALVEMHHGLLGAGLDEHLVRFARSAKLTLVEARRVGLVAADIERLRKAGVR